MKLHFLSFFVFLFSLPLLAQNDSSYAELYFQKGKWTLNSNEKAKLDEFDFRDAYVLAGYTDNSADSSFNYELSKMRVQEVEKLLLSKGIHAKQVTKYYFGERSTRSDELSSRRVEVYSYSISAEESTLDKQLSILEDTVIRQVFSINTAKDTVIQCLEGTRIEVEAGSFKAANIELEVKEYYDMDDIILANLATVSNGKMLESKGMIYLQASVDGKEINPINPLKISMKNDEDTLAQDYQIFSGLHDAHGRLDWKVNSNANIRNRPLISRISSGFNYRNRLRQYFDKYITKSMRDGYKEEYKTCKNYQPKINKIKTYMSVDADGNISLIDKNYVIQDSSIAKGRKFYILGKLNRFCFDYCSEIISSLSPLPVKLRPRYSVVAKYKYLASLYNYTGSKVIRRPAQNNNISFSTLQMGWINCDRFLNSPNPVIVRVDNPEKLQVVMIAKKMKSLINSYDLDHQARFDNIPKDMEMTVFAYKVRPDNTYSFSSVDASADGELIELPDAQILSAEGFRARLKEFN